MSRDLRNGDSGLLNRGTGLWNWLALLVQVLESPARETANDGVSLLSGLRLRDGGKTGHKRCSTLRNEAT